MKKLVFYIIMVILLTPIMCLGITCGNDTFLADIKIDNDKISLGDKSFISVSSDFIHKEEYKSSNKDIALIDDNGIISSLKEGKTNITIIVNFFDNVDNDEISYSCHATINLEVLSNDSKLKSLNLEELDISSIFQANKYIYDIALPYRFNSVNIIAESSSKTAKITGDGKRYLNEGLNEYSIIVTASDGSTTTYKVNITREPANDDTTLENLIVEGFILSPQFNPENYKYSIDVDKSVQEITINAKPTYNFANVSGTGTFSLATGRNIFYITVFSENGNEGKYEIEINKNNGSSKLNNLVIEGYSLDTPFDSSTYIYHLTVNSNVYALNINAEALENDQVEIIGNENFKIGENDVIIRVTNKDKTNTTYKIVVNKLSEDMEKIIQRNSILLKFLFCLFIISILITAILITIFIKRNHKKHWTIKLKRKRKK